MSSFTNIEYQLNALLTLVKVIGSEIIVLVEYNKVKGLVQVKHCRNFNSKLILLQRNKKQSKNCLILRKKKTFCSNK